MYLVRDMGAVDAASPSFISHCSGDSTAVQDYSCNIIIEIIDLLI